MRRPTAAPTTPSPTCTRHEQLRGSSEGYTEVPHGQLRGAGDGVVRVRRALHTEVQRVPA